MTPQQKKHCSHECVCKMYHIGMLAIGPISPRPPCANNENICIHDTRTTEEEITHTYTAKGDANILIADGFSTDWLFEIKKGETVQIVRKKWRG